ncbi:hypothetical protein [Sphingomonas morindae]|uniref:Uncharacterized protein n=1 Tax=Sphingomonas morindae TaxID=1541170 RepID=A0ABY4X3J9_9SPHN|nr:hypothetical protein [Sphingomonas morindae]USI71455.1 hypothetical protein LHA26_08870 [Sphingomonas morindae]
MIRISDASASVSSAWRGSAYSSPATLLRWAKIYYSYLQYGPEDTLTVKRRSMLTAFYGFMLAAVAVGNAADAARCTLAGSRYSLRHDQAVRAGFVKDGRADGSLRFFILSKKTGRTYWFHPELPGSGAGPSGLLSYDTEQFTAQGVRLGGARYFDKAVDLAVIVADAHYDISSAQVFSENAMAPAHLLIPDLHAALWYDTAPNAREDIALSFFDLDGCTQDLPKLLK